VLRLPVVVFELDITSKKSSSTPLRNVGDRIPKRIACVLQIRTERRDGRTFVVYELSDSLVKPMGSGASR
jgi:hypothetical protein